MFIQRQHGRRDSATPHTSQLPRLDRRFVKQCPGDHTEIVPPHGISVLFGPSGVGNIEAVRGTVFSDDFPTKGHDDTL